MRKNTINLGLVLVCAVGYAACTPEHRNFDEILGGDAAVNDSETDNPTGDDAGMPEPDSNPRDDGGMMTNVGDTDTGNQEDASAGAGGDATMPDSGTSGGASNMETGGAGGDSSQGGRGGEGGAGGTGEAGSGGEGGAGGSGEAGSGGEGGTSAAAGAGGMSSGGAGGVGGMGTGGGGGAGGVGGSGGGNGGSGGSGGAPTCTPSSATEVLCDNVTDDDCDGLTDCDDDDCASDVNCAPACVPTMAQEGNCGDGIDDDCDGLTDCEDNVDCETAPECLPDCVPVSSSEGLCADGADDDCDGFVDCDDSDCNADAACQTACVPVTEVCADTTDNDCDGFADCADSECAPTAACCTASGPEVCTDGVDNNCDGVIDCPVIVNTFPDLPPPERVNWEGGTTSADRATIRLDTPTPSEYVVQCRSGKPAEISGAAFTVCNASDPKNLTVMPFDASDATDPTLNGVMETQVRFAYPNGSVSQVASFTYYVHNSLAGATICPQKATDAAYFEAARPALVSDGSPLFANADAKLTAPFVNIGFVPPLSGVFEIASGDGDVEYLSLRRRFMLSPDKSMILMKRVFWSRRATTRRCLTAMMRVHDYDNNNDYDANRYYRNGCDAVVMNREGAGACLVVDSSGNPQLAYKPSASWGYAAQNQFFNWNAADNLMWRKMLRRNIDGSFKVFSPKCYAGGASCAAGNPDMLFLPDRNLFSW